jgi:branched-chain amino acid transport system permease protein
MDLATFLQQVVNGLSLGSLYALIAIGYTMVYGILRLINFAHGDLIMVSAYVGWGGSAGLVPWPAGWPWRLRAFWGCSWNWGLIGP